MWVGKRSLIQGGGLVTRIRADLEPQLDDYRIYCEKPDLGINSVALSSLGTQKPINIESDNSEDDDVLPAEECWAIPDDGWTLVDKSHAKSRGVHFGPKPSHIVKDDRMTNAGTGYDTLDEIVDNSVLIKYQRKLARNTKLTLEISSDDRTVSVDGKLSEKRQPDRLFGNPVDIVKPNVSDHPDQLMGFSLVNMDSQTDCLTSMRQTPRDGDSDTDGIKEEVECLLPVNRVMVQDITAEEAITDVCPVRRLVGNKLAKLIVSTELVDLPQKRITRGFLELAEEARQMDVGQTPSDLRMQSSEMCDQGVWTYPGG